MQLFSLLMLSSQDLESSCFACSYVFGRSEAERYQSRRVPAYIQNSSKSLEVELISQFLKQLLKLLGSGIKIM